MRNWVGIEVERDIKAVSFVVISVWVLVMCCASSCRELWEY